MSGEAFADHFDNVRGRSIEAGRGDRVAIHRGCVERRQIDRSHNVGRRDTVQGIRGGHHFAAFDGLHPGKQFPESVVNV